MFRVDETDKWVISPTVIARVAAEGCDVCTSSSALARAAVDTVDRRHPSRELSRAGTVPTGAAYLVNISTTMAEGHLTLGNIQYCSLQYSLISLYNETND